MGGAILRSLIWGVIAAALWLAGAFILTGAWGYFRGWKADEFLGGARPPGWRAAEDMAVLMTILVWAPLSPVAFIAGAVLEWRKTGGKPPVIDE